MRLKNYNEDLVLETVKIVLKDRPDIQPSRSFLLDVAAYALNRIPPKYITSERGFTREFVQANNGNGEESGRLVSIIELITLVNRAVDVVARRRRDGVPSRPRARTVLLKDTDLHLTYFYNILCRIVDGDSASRDRREGHALDQRPRVRAGRIPGWESPHHQRADEGVLQLLATGNGGSGVDADDLRIARARGLLPFSVKKSLKSRDFFVHDISAPTSPGFRSLSLQPVDQCSRAGHVRCRATDRSSPRAILTAARRPQGAAAQP
jgi:hypothetical protein